MPRGRPKKKSPKTGRRKRSSSAPPSLNSPRKRLKWSNESMEQAMEAVKKGFSVKRAAEVHKHRKIVSLIRIRVCDVLVML